MIDKKAGKEIDKDNYGALKNKIESDIIRDKSGVKQ